jgi:phenylpropionate dioxygenase-like ring-hydroxylating dioxygenase large terminal subunit
MTSYAWQHAEGRIEESDGSLMCSYHGWRFNGEGACTRIPQALDPKAEATACSSSRACAAAFPTQVMACGHQFHASIIGASKP